MILRAEQEGRSFAWQLSPELAERVGDDLREHGWIVTILPDPEDPSSPSDPQDSDDEQPAED